MPKEKDLVINTMIKKNQVTLIIGPKTAFHLLEIHLTINYHI